MNVLVLSELYYPHGGGAEFATHLFANFLKNQGLNTVIVTNRFPGQNEITKDGTLNIYRIPLFKKGAGSKFSLLIRVDILISNLMRKLLEWSDIVYIPRLWFSAILLAKAYQKPVIVHLHDYIPLCPISTMYDSSKDTTCGGQRSYCSFKCIYALERGNGSSEFKATSSVILNSTIGRLLSRLTELSDAIICPSHAQRDVIVNRRPSLRSKIHVIHNPIPEVRQVKIGGSDFAYFGGPNRMKGFHTLFTAALDFEQRFHRKVNIHVSDFSRISPAFSARLAKRGFIPYGRLSGSAYDHVYAQVRSVILPSICLEVSPYVSVEALLRERLLITSSAGRVAEIVERCPGVYTFPSGDSTQLAKTMEYVSGLSCDVVADLGARNRENLQKEFNNRDSSKSFVQLLTRVQNKNI